MSSVKDRPQTALILVIQKVIMIRTLLWTLIKTWSLDPWSTTFPWSDLDREWVF
jgi:hypothetical protein